LKHWKLNDWAIYHWMVVPHWFHRKHKTYLLVFFHLPLLHSHIFFLFIFVLRLCCIRCYYEGCISLIYVLLIYSIINGVRIYHVNFSFLYTLNRMFCTTNGCYLWQRSNVFQQLVIINLLQFLNMNERSFQHFWSVVVSLLI